MNQTIIHFMPNQTGGTPKHIYDLQQLFPEKNHLMCSSISQLSSLLRENNLNIFRFHLHSCVNENYLPLIPILKKLDKMIQLYMTVHDYQWFSRYNPNPTRECFLHTIYDSHDLSNLTILFHLMNVIIFPSKKLFDNYSLLIDLPIQKCHITPHCDVPVPIDKPIPIRLEQDEPIRIAFVGYYTPVKGNNLWNQLIDLFPVYVNRRIEYHVFGHVHEGTSNCGKMILHGKYEDDNLVSLLYKERIHLICHLSVAEETYCYALTRTMQSKIPILYLNRGAFPERLEKYYSSYYMCCENSYELIPKLKELISKIMMNRECRTDTKISNKVVKTEWYERYY